MALVEAIAERSAFIARRRQLAAMGYVLLAGVVAWWAWRALNDPMAYDGGLAYRAGQVASSTGHPEHLWSWSGTPFLAAAMAVLSHFLNVRAAVDVLTISNLVLVVGVVWVVTSRLRGTLSPLWLWLAAFALLSFGPMMSSVWWKQFNIVALALTLAGFELLRRDRTQQGAALIGLSIAIKPLAILLPFVLLARRETRRAGQLALAWIAALNLVALGLMAVRAHDLGALNPYTAFHNFLLKSRPANIWACEPANFAPGSLLCRLAGPQYATLQHFVVWLAVGLLGMWVINALRGRSVRSWEALAFTLPLSVMLSPLGWSHYQVVLAPLFVLLLVRFTREGASFSAWAGLATAFGLASLLWLPYGTLVGAARGLASGHVETRSDLSTIETVAQFAQYVLILTGVLWYMQIRGVDNGRVRRPKVAPSPR
jgi:hypothetical protein